MKQSFFKIFIVSMILVLAASTAFAGSINDNKEIKSFNDEIEAFNKEYDKLKAELELAYDKNDAVAYRDAKRAIAKLKEPVLTEEKSNAIAESLKDDEYEAANWLFVNSRFYNPSIEFVSEGENFNYHQTFSANPGTSVKMPELRAPRIKLFKGWGSDTKTVLYKAGEEIKMPVKDLTLYAVFEDNPNAIIGASIEISNKKVKGSDELILERSKQQSFEFTVKNNGSEDLANLKIGFDSEDPLFVVLTDSLYCRGLRSGDSGTARFKVITKASSQTKLTGNITVEDSNGHQWKENVEFTVK